jgi:citrate lyase subunit beta/citryl-CoA lyase
MHRCLLAGRRQLSFLIVVPLQGCAELLNPDHTMTGSFDARFAARSLPKPGICRHHRHTLHWRPVVTHRPRRSALYLPASNAKAIAKARTLACDVVILDLEDAVAPDAKAMARDQAVAAVNEAGFGTRELVVRVNALDTEWGADDLAALGACAPDAVLVPKVMQAGDVDRYANRLAATTPIWAMIETTASLFRLDSIAGADRLTALVMGTNDLAKETGAQPGTDRLPIVGALGLAVAAARLHGRVILDGVFNGIDDDDGFALQARQAVEFGFDGKTLIHPRQIEPCNAAFLPDAAALAWARQIIAAFDLPENSQKGAIRVDGKMVERLHLHQAQRVIAAAILPG